jgi:AcrR family transcriptional regulator
LSMRSARRVDAAKNRERLIGEARTLFSTGDGTVTLDAIARAAGVGIGTLYRHFATREMLVEAVYRLELDGLEAEADNLLENHRGFEAMRRWMDRYARFVATKHAMHEALRISFVPRTSVVSEIRVRITTTVAKFIKAGSLDGSLRNDLQSNDVTLGLAGIVLVAAASTDPDQVGRLLDLLMAGLRKSP